MPQDIFGEPIGFDGFPCSVSAGPVGFCMTRKSNQPGVDLFPARDVIFEDAHLLTMPIRFLYKRSRPYPSDD